MTSMRHLLLVLVCLTLVGCGGEQVEVVDLDKVLEIFDRVAQQEAPATVTGSEGQAVPVALQDVDPQTINAFLDAFEKELNEAKLISDPIGVELQPDGSIVGFRDRDGNGEKDARDEQLFMIVIEPGENRIVASQEAGGETYYRDHHYHHHHYGGAWGYWMYGSMWGRQRSYYTNRGMWAPSFRNTSMSPRGYHGAAVTRARAASGSARSSGGSRGFFGGK